MCLNCRAGILFHEQLIIFDELTLSKQEAKSWWVKISVQGKIQRGLTLDS